VSLSLERGWGEASNNNKINTELKNFIINHVPLRRRGVGLPAACLPVGRVGRGEAFIILHFHLCIY